MLISLLHLLQDDKDIQNDNVNLIEIVNGTETAQTTTSVTVPGGEGDGEEVGLMITVSRATTSTSPKQGTSLVRM